MGKLLLIYAAVIFIAGVILFTFAMLKKDKEVEEPETNAWTRVLSIMLIVIAAACLFISINMW